MRLATVLLDGAPRAAQVVGDEVVLFEPGTDVRDLLVDPREAAGERLALDGLELLAPCAPRILFGVGLNYADHAAEGGRELPERPIVFTMAPGASAAPGGRVRVPELALKRLDYEGELAVVMADGGRVAGFAVADDLSARHLQRSEPQWTRAKGFDGGLPWGPWITTADEVDVSDLRLRTWVDGELRQDARTSDMVFSVQQVVDFLAETITLQPGDLIVTGTPAGVGFAMDPPRWLQRGSRVRIEIERLGAIEHEIA
jgi:2-keto-4-pentenoate hydratase/2-oxohepta-3-ene-1,7-dioic acid hydratase in catechol pathway